MRRVREEIERQQEEENIRKEQEQGMVTFPKYSLQGFGTFSDGQKRPPPLFILFFLDHCYTFSLVTFVTQIVFDSMNVVLCCSPWLHALCLGLIQLISISVTTRYGVE